MSADPNEIRDEQLRREAEAEEAARREGASGPTADKFERVLGFSIDRAGLERIADSHPDAEVTHIASKVLNRDDDGELDKLELTDGEARLVREAATKIEPAALTGPERGPEESIDDFR